MNIDKKGMSATIKIMIGLIVLLLFFFAIFRIFSNMIEKGFS